MVWWSFHVAGDSDAVTIMEISLMVYPSLQQTVDVHLLSNSAVRVQGDVSINDLSGGQIAIHLSGSDVPDLLAKGCTLDLHPSVFGVGACAQSGLAKTIVLLGHIDKAPVYELIVRRSFSEYALRWLRQN